MNRIFIWSLSVYLMTISLVHADPNISGTTGTFSTGERVRITGTGFGTKAHPGPLLWDNFENGKNGAPVADTPPIVENLAGTWTWDDYTSQTYRPTFGNTRQRQNSTLSSEHYFVGETYNNSLEIDFPREKAGDEVYFSFYYFYDKLSNNWSRNHKPWIVYGNTGYYTAAYDGWGNPSEGDGSFRNSVQDTGNTGPTLWSEPSISAIEGEWIRIEGFLRVSSADRSDGAWNVWIHRPYAGSPSIKLEQSDNSYRTRSSNNYWRQWHFGSYHDNIPTNAEAKVYIDDIYFDDTQARVELCNAPTWSTCTQRELQIPVTWDTNSIDFDVNYGAFSENQQVFLYVVDRGGNVNIQGHPVQLGASLVVRPNPPTDLQAISD